MITKRFAMAVAIYAGIVGVVAGSANATITDIVTGVSSAGVPIKYEADLTITGNALVIELFNLSPVHSQNPADVLSSFYFDIKNGLNVRPTLTYVSAIGDVWLPSRDNPDTLVQANANIKAVNAGDNSWQFRVMTPTSNPFTGFGIGCVGNMNLAPNNFMGNIVDGIDYSIYTGEVTTQNLDGKLLVKDHATYNFTGVAGYTEADIRPNFAFGGGTTPDSLYTPEPASIAFLALGGLLLIRRR